MKNKTELSGLSAQLSRARSKGPSLAQLLSVDAAAEQQKQSLSAHYQKIAASRDLSRAQSHTSQSVRPGIKFGTLPGSKGESSSRQSNEWSNLLAKTATGGLSNAFGGGLLSFAGGLGGLFSSIAGLFGGGAKKSLPPLTAFELPGSQNQLFVTSDHLSTSKLPPASPSTGIYGAVQSNSAGVQPGDQNFGQQSMQIAQAVKLALLNSSSLNDVIAEL